MAYIGGTSMTGENGILGGRTIAEHIRSGYAYHRIITDGDNKPVDYVFLEVNSAFEALTDMKSEDVIGRRATEVFPGIEKGQPDLIGIYGRVALEGGQQRFDLHFEPVDKWFSLLVFSPTPGYFAVMFDDITDWRQKEIDLTATNERFRVIFENVMDGMLIADVESRKFIMGNEKICRMLGYGTGELQEIGVEEIHPPEALDEALEAFDRSAREGVEVNIELPVLRKDGSILHADINASPVTIGGRSCLIGSFRDATKRKLLSDSIIASKKDWESTFDTISDAITIHDRDFNIIRANKAASEMLGLSYREILSRKCFASYHGTACAPPGCPTCQVLNKAEPVVCEIYEPHLEKHLEIHGLPRFDEDGSLIGLVHVVHDITERKKAEEKLRAARDDLEVKVRERTDDLHVALERLEELDQMKNMFIASTSHELRTPLNAIIGFTGVVLMGMAGDLNDEQKKQLGLVKDNADHLLTLIEDIIDVSKIESGRLETRSETFAIGAVAREVAAAVELAAVDKGLRLFLEAGEGDVTVRSDRHRVKQILLNLMGNAVKFTAEGSVGIRIEEGEQEVRITVKDSGPGIATEEKGKLFKPFSRLTSNGRGIIQGTGLGLYLCSKLAQLLRGDIALESTPGTGSSFTLTLPL